MEHDIKLIDPREFDFAVSKLRAFFRDKMGFVETHVQSGLDILAACEDPFNIATFDYAGDVWPMSQTGQMRLEQQLLTDPSLPGLFCVTTSYRQEPDPKPGRHDLIFPMFEFETHGDMDRLEQLERKLIEFWALIMPGRPLFIGRMMVQRIGITLRNSLMFMKDVSNRILAMSYS